MNRRTFLKLAAVGSSGVGLFPGHLLSTAARGLTSEETLPTPSWVDKPMRWAQLTLVEDDPGKFDPQFWLDYFRRTRSDAVCLGAGGCVAFYPTDIPFHHRSRWLGNSDPFGELVAGCRKLGMVVIGRTDPHATYDDVQLAHPDWIAVDAKGNPRRHWASPELWVTCALGPYNFDFMTRVKREIMSRYRLDAIFINRWDGSGMCYCEHCRRNFRDASGYDLPFSNNPQDPARRAYVLWRQQRLFDLWRTWDAAVRKINPDSCVIPNTGGGATSSLDMRRIGELAPTLMADRQARRGLAPPWANGRNGKEFRATMGRKPIIGIFSVGVEEPYRWKDSVQSEPEIRLWVSDGVANGLRPWFTKFSGVLHDRRWLKPVEALYRRYAAWEPYLRNDEPITRVGLVYSQQSSWFRSGNLEEHGNGWYQALIEARIPFEMVHDRLLQPAALTRLKTLILPSIAALSDEQCEQVRQFVKAGGGVVATFETSLCDEWGQARKDFGLGDLFGAAFAGRVDGPMQNSYLRLEHGAAGGQAHPLLDGLEDAPRIINSARRVVVRPVSTLSDVPVTLVPSYPDLPMEMVYPREGRTTVPQVFLREFGTGRVVYFPGDIDRTFWEVLSVDHFKLMRNAVLWATNEEPVATVEGPGILDVVVWRQKHSMTVHLVNLTNPMMMKGPVRELIPVGEQKVAVCLPGGTRPRRVHLLAAQRSVRYSLAGTWLKLKVPSVLDHEIVAIDL